MIVLLDTHYLIWSLSADRRLTAKARELIEDPGQPIAVSIVSLWEIAIKTTLGKLDVQGGVGGVLSRLPEMGYELLPLSPVHLEVVESLPLHHRDPFDRMLIAQARHEGMHLLTTDLEFGKYGVRLVAG